MQNAKFVYEGHNADLYIYDEKIVISGKKFNKGMGEKTIPMASISAVQIKPSSFLLYGYITFNVLGEVANSSALGRSYTSENTVTVKKRADDSIMKEIKNFIEEAKMKASTSVSQTIIQEKVPLKK